VLQPGGLGRRERLWCEGGTTGGGRPPSAGGGHGSLAGSLPLPEAPIGYADHDRARYFLARVRPYRLLAERRSSRTAVRLS
jgi:hypothetical protein